MARSEAGDTERATRMRRPDWDVYFMRMAVLAASRSTCLRRRVGAVIVKAQMVLSTGYNDTPRGLPNCGEGGCPRCASDAPAGTALDACYCLHAEQNAIIQAAYHGVAIAGATMHVTHQPCLTCAKMIVNVGIRRIVFAGEYPDALALDLLQRAEVTLERLAAEPADVP